MKYKGDIEILELIEGAKRAEGLTVIIDVFRAFSMECYLYGMGAEVIRPVGTVEEVFEWKKRDPGCILIGERGGKMCEGFDLGNSPSQADPHRVSGSRIIHTTSAGTQGIINAAGADEIITGSLVNAAAISEYIRQKAPDKLSLVCMGNAGIAPSGEDRLCAEYIRSLLLEEDIYGFDEKLVNLQYEDGKHFFEADRQHIFPEKDFWMCIKKDIFDFVIRIEKDEFGFVSRLKRMSSALCQD